MWSYRSFIDPVCARLLAFAFLFALVCTLGYGLPSLWVGLDLGLIVGSLYFIALGAGDRRPVGAA